MLVPTGSHYYSSPASIGRAVTVTVMQKWTKTYILEGEYSNLGYMNLDTQRRLWLSGWLVFIFP